MDSDRTLEGAKHQGKQRMPESLFEVATLSSTTKPFVKWAGGKSKLLPELAKRVPDAFGAYFEPFVGGGALFFALLPRTATLGDANAELVNAYAVVRDYPEELLTEISKLKVSEEEYYRIRAKDVKSLSEIERAARFIYLNKTCFNGLYRVNRFGQFNTPFGHYTAVKLADRDNLFRASAALQGIEILNLPYDTLLLEQVKTGDFVYLDPPYFPVSKWSDFKRYTARQFRADDQSKLAQTFNELDRRGALLLLSNSYHPEVEQLYSGHRIELVRAPRSINCKGDRRGEVKELIVTNF